MHIDENIMKYISAETDWSHNIIQQAIEAAVAKGISLDEYVRFSCWELTDNEMDELSVLLEQVHIRQKQEEEWYLQIAHRRSLRPIASLRKEVKQLKQLGVPSHRYARQGLFYPVRNKHALKKAQQKKKQVQKKNAYFYKICKKTGWSASRTEIEVTKAWLNCGANYENYFRFNMHKCSAEEQKTYLTREHYNKMTFFWNDYFAKRLLNKKSSFNRIYSPYIKRRWFINRNLSYTGFLKKIHGLENILVKPVNTTHGKGIQKFSCNVEDKKALYNMVMAFPESVVEEYIVQHPDIAAFCSSSVNTVRVVTLNAHGTCNILFAIIRMGQGDIVDNVHAGGIAAGVDVKTGVISTDAIDADDQIYITHPCSNLPIRGFQIPNWDAVIDLCQKCYRKIPGVNLIGWDIAITSDGVDLIEGNSSPAFDSAQALSLQLGKGLRADIATPFLPEY